jgi:hypothetical protein
MPGSQHVIRALTKGGIGQLALELLPGDRLQDNPRVLRQFPQGGIKLPPQGVGPVIPQAAHVQSQFRQDIESIDSRG